jgi:hypothetical protein
MRETGPAAHRAKPDEHNQAPTARNHRPDGHSAGKSPSRVNIEALYRSPTAIRDLLRRRAELTAGAVDQHIDRPETLDRRIDDALDLLGLAHVRLNRHAAAAGPLDSLCGRVERPLAAAADDNIRTGRGKLTGGRAPDACPTPGDQRDTSLVRTNTQRRRSRGRFASARHATHIEI